MSPRPTQFLILHLLLAACTGPDTRLDLSAQVAGGQLAYGAAASADAKQRFFGDSGGGGGGDSGSGGGDGLLSTGDVVDAQGMPPTVTQITLSRDVHLGGLTVTTSLQAGYQYLQAKLPKGIGVLTDPLTIKVWARSLGLQMTLADSMALTRKLTLTYAAGLGATAIDARAHMTSDLLDLRGHSRKFVPYTTVEARLRGEAGPDLLAQALMFEDGTHEMRLGVAQSF